MPQYPQAYLTKKRFSIALRRIVTRDAPGREFTRYLGMSSDSFREFIHQQLRPEFTFANYGRTWVLDHIAPCFLFDQESETDLVLCWNYINVIPMPILLNRCKALSIDFATEELDIRGQCLPNNTTIPQLKQRIFSFVDELRRYHTPKTHWEKVQC